MINRQDCVLLLTELQDDGADVKQQLVDVFNPSKLPEVIKYINSQRQIELVAFYDKIRKSYNNHRSNLYINIVKETINPEEVLTTLAALQLQILLFAKNIKSPQSFLRSSRISEISMVLNNYYKTYDLTECIKLLTLIKADLKVSEWVNGRIS